MQLSQGTVVRTIGLHDVQAKLLAAAPRILAENRAMVTQMLETVKEEIEPITPLGPGHFGYHLRDSYVVDVASSGVKTTGVLRAPVQGYWREFGTRGLSRKRGRALGLSVRETNSAAAFMGGGGERAGMYAHKLLAGVRKFLNFYYGKAQWWRL